METDQRMRFVITGATGFIGGHVAEAAHERNHQVSALARPTSDIRELEKLGITVHRGEPDDAALARSTITEADVVVHCAAKVGDWGPVADYRRANVDNLRV